MSLKLLTAVFDSKVPSGPKLVLLAMADWGNDDGLGIYPSIDKLSLKCSYARSTTKRWLSWCIERKLVGLKRKGGGLKTNEWRLFPDAIREYAGEGAEFDTRSSLTRGEGVKLDPDPLSNPLPGEGVPSPSGDVPEDGSQESEQQTPTRPSKERPRNLFFDAVRETMFIDVPDAGLGARVGMVIKVIRAYEVGQGRNHTPEDLAAKVRRFWVWYGKETKGASLKDPVKVQEWWAKFDAVKPPAPPKRLVEPTPWVDLKMSQTDYLDMRAREQEEKRKRDAIEFYRKLGVDVSKYEND